MEASLGGTRVGETAGTVGGARDLGATVREGKGKGSGGCRVSGSRMMMMLTAVIVKSLGRMCYARLG